ncbi:O-antigen polymerase [Enterococcus sp. LJL120]
MTIDYKNGESNQKHKFFSFITIFLLLMQMSKRMGLEVYLLLNSPSFLLLDQSRISIILIFLFIISFYLSMKFKNLRIYLIPTMLFIATFFLFLLNSFINVDTVSVTTGFFINVTGYLSLLILLVVMSVRVNFFSSEVITKTVFSFSLIQCVIGFIQYVLNIPIVPTTFNGEYYLNPVFYLNGVSSNRDAYLTFGAQVRAFGLTDSGLTLGMFALLLCSISLFSNIKKTKKILLVIFSLVVVYMTLTRIIYLATIVVLIIYYLLTKKKFFLVKMAIIIFTICQSLFTFFVVSFPLDYLNVFDNFGMNLSSVVSRIEGLRYFISTIPLSPLKILFGMNFTAWVTNVSTLYSLDNELLKTVFDIGIVGYLILYGVFVYVIFKNISVMSSSYYSNFDKGLVCFLASFPFVGLGNVVAYFYIGICVILVLRNYSKKMGANENMVN